jgi:hypothetical protein
VTIPWLYCIYRMYVDIHAHHVNHTMNAICLGVIFEKVDDVLLNIKK